MSSLFADVSEKRIYDKYIYILAGVYASVLLIFCLVFDFNGLYGQDSYAYLLYTKKITAFFLNGNPPGDFFWPTGYPFISACLNTLIHNENISCLFISIFSSALIFIFLSKILRICYPENPKTILVYLSLFYCLSPFMFRTSVVVMSEMLSMLFITIVFYCFIYYKKSNKIIYFLGTVLFSVLSAWVRYPAFILIIWPLVMTCIYFFKNRKSSLLINLILAGLIVLVCVDIYVKELVISVLFKNDFLHSWSFLNYFKNSFYTVDGYSQYTFVNILYPLAVLVNPGFMLGGFLMIFFVRKTDLEHVFLITVLLSSAMYALFLAGISFQNLRVLSIMYPLILMLLFPAFVNFLGRIIFIKKHYTLLFMALVLVQFVLIGRAVYPFCKMNKHEKEMAQRLKKYDRYKILYTSGTEGFLKVYNNHLVLKSIWENKIDSFQINTLILINPAELERQWKGKNPYINWMNVKIHYNPLKLESLPSGWELYEIR